MCTGLPGQAYHGGTPSHSGAWPKWPWPGTQPSSLPLTTAVPCMVGGLGAARAGFTSVCAWAAGISSVSMVTTGISSVSMVTADLNTRVYYSYCLHSTVLREGGLLAAHEAACLCLPCHLQLPAGMAASSATDLTRSPQMASSVHGRATMCSWTLEMTCYSTRTSAAHTHVTADRSSGCHFKCSMVK